MTSNNLLELAKQGKLKAIESLINEAMPPQGITAKVGFNWKNGYLYISLVSVQCPDQQALVPLIKEKVASLGCESIKKVRISGVQQGQTSPNWQQEIDIVNQAISVSHPSPNNNFEANVKENRGQVAVGKYFLQIGSIHGGEVKLALPEQQPCPHLRSTPVLMLPRPFPDILGRKLEIEDAMATLKSALPVEFYAEAGVGKTTLLRYLANHPQIAQIFPDGIVYLLARKQTLADLLQSLFEAFYESDVPFKPTYSQIQQNLQSKKALILLDEVQLSRDEVVDLLNVAPDLTFLLASPERCLWGEGKVEALQGLPLDDALALLKRELGRSLTSEELPAAEAICKALNGHPLELLQTVAWVGKDNRDLVSVARQVQSATSPKELLAQLLESLPEPDKRVLALLAALAGVAMLIRQAAALTHISQIDSILKKLQERHLVQSDGTRYSLSSNLVELLQQRWDLTGWLEKALTYFRTWAAHNQPAPNELLAESDVLLQILEWTVKTQRWTDTLPLVTIVEGALALSGQWDKWNQAMQWSLQAARSLGDQAAEAWTLHQLGTRSLCLEESAIAQTYLNQALEIRESLGDQIGATLTRNNLNLLLSTSPIPDSEPPSSQTHLPETSTPHYISHLHNIGFLQNITFLPTLLKVTALVPLVLGGIGVASFLNQPQQGNPNPEPIPEQQTTETPSPPSSPLSTDPTNPSDIIKSQVQLEWDTADDLDLVIVKAYQEEPQSEEEMLYRTRSNKIVKDVSANDQCENISTNPVEKASFELKEQNWYDLPPDGKFLQINVHVVLKKRCASSVEIPFRGFVKIGEKEVTFNSSLNNENEAYICLIQDFWERDELDADCEVYSKADQSI